MPPAKQNLSAFVDAKVRRRYLDYCETNKIQKGGLLERLITSFLDGKALTPEDIGRSK